MRASYSPEFDEHEAVFTYEDAATGLLAIVAIHSTALGPAIGGTRYWRYPDVGSGLDDALRLSRAMSLKAALSGAPMGGGKAVIIADPDRPKTPELIAAYGAFLNRVGDLFATGRTSASA